MLSCFRSVVNQSLHFRPSLRPTAFFSTSLARKDEAQYADLVGVLNEEGRRELKEKEDDDEGRPAFTRVISGTLSFTVILTCVTQPIELTEGGQDGSYGTYKEKIRGFLRNRVLPALLLTVSLQLIHNLTPASTSHRIHS